MVFPIRGINLALSVHPVRGIIDQFCRLKAQKKESRNSSCRNRRGFNKLSFSSLITSVVWQKLSVCQCVGYSLRCQTQLLRLAWPWAPFSSAPSTRALARHDSS